MMKIVTLPFAAVLRWFYTITGSYGLALILFSLVAKLVILPFQMKSKRGMVRMGRLSAKQAELQKKYAKNQQKLQEETMKLYQEAGVNPMSGCLWSFIPMFILIPLYSIIRQPITYFMNLGNDVLENIRTMATSMGYTAAMRGGVLDPYEQIGLAHFISKPENWTAFEETPGLIQMNFDFLGVDLSVMPQEAFHNFHFSWAVIGLMLIPVLAAALQYLMTFLMAKSNGQAAQQPQMKVMNLMMPLMTVWFCFIMPASLGIYWIANSLFAMIQEVVLGKFYNDKLNREEDEREAKREAARQMRMEEARQRALEHKDEEPEKRTKKQPQHNPDKENATNEAGRVGNRPYARGRSYVEDRYKED